ncbi:MAG: PIG-L family deacetylase [Spirochaetaceae bacterium]|nr:MAG: PIG-L family deacetylase [Spirochaetaceae bacterium]
MSARPGVQGQSGIRTVVVAHPDDEILWMGGTLLMETGRRWNVVTLCRGSDVDRAPKFSTVMRHLGATGTMGDVNDGPEQNPLSPREVREAVLELLAGNRAFDVLFTHSPRGEYTRHRRHEEVGWAVCDLWTAGDLDLGELRLFAYEDGQHSRLPTAIETAHSTVILPEEVFKEKLRIITELYGFPPEGWEARACPQVEAFWCFREPESLIRWLEQGGFEP